MFFNGKHNIFILTALLIVIVLSVHFSFHLFFFLIGTCIEVYRLLVCIMMWMKSWGILKSISRFSSRSLNDALRTLISVTFSFPILKNDSLYWNPLHYYSKKLCTRNVVKCQIDLFILLGCLILFSCFDCRSLIVEL